MSIKLYKTGAWLVVEDTVQGTRNEYLSTGAQITNSLTTRLLYDIYDGDKKVNSNVALADMINGVDAAYTEGTLDTFRLESLGTVNAPNATAGGTTFDNAASGLAATNVQDAIDEVAGGASTITTGITAFATGGQASAVALTTELNNITTCATAGDSVKLPTAVAGAKVTVKNNGAAAADVFPFTGDSIDALAVNLAVRLAVGSTITFFAKDTTVWESSIVGAGTVGNPSLPIGATDTGLYEVSGTQTGFAQDGALVAIFDGDGITADSVRNRIQLGTTPVGTVSVEEYGTSWDMTTVLTLTDFVIGAIPAVAAAAAVGNIVYAFPAGQHFELVSSLSSIVLTIPGTTVSTDTGIGSVKGTGAVAVLSGTSTFEDRLTGQTISAEAGGGAAVSALTAATAGIGTGISLNVAASIKNVFLNSAGTWNIDNEGDLTATGTIVLKWSRMD